MILQVMFRHGYFIYTQVDVFSFGIVLWEILTGEEPYANMHYGAIIGKLLSLFPFTLRFFSYQVTNKVVYN